MAKLSAIFYNSDGEWIGKGDLEESATHTMKLVRKTIVKRWLGFIRIFDAKGEAFASGAVKEIYDWFKDPVARL